MSVRIDKNEKYFLHNNDIKETSKTSIRIPSNAKNLYEVIRVINSKPLFLNKHLVRLQKSLILSDIQKIDIEKVGSNIKKLIALNPVEEKNLKINCIAANEICELFAYFIESHYPSKLAYIQGVKVELLPMQRKMPNVKLENPVLRGSADKAICISQTHEVLLVNDMGFITEGSRSNFFAVMGNILVTPPSNLVLEGITRNMIIQLAQQNSIEIIERPIHCSELHTISGAFITGTSSKVLPIIRIGDISFAGIPELTKKLMIMYDNLVEQSLQMR